MSNCLKFNIIYVNLYMIVQLVNHSSSLVALLSNFPFLALQIETAMARSEICDIPRAAAAPVISPWPSGSCCSKPLPSGDSIRLRPGPRHSYFSGQPPAPAPSPGPRRHAPYRSLPPLHIIPRSHKLPRSDSPFHLSFYLQLQTSLVLP